MTINSSEILNVKIVSDGTVTGTKVTLLDGTLIKGITAMNITQKAGELPKATLDIALYSLEVETQLEYINVNQVFKSLQ